MLERILDTQHLSSHLLYLSFSGQQGSSLGQLPERLLYYSAILLWEGLVVVVVHGAVEL